MFLVAGELEVADGRGRPDQRGAAAGDDAFLDGGAGGVQGVFNQGLALFHLGLGGGPDVDLGDAAGELGEPLLQLLLVVLAVGVADLAADHLGPGLDLGRGAGPFDDRGVLAVDRDLLGAAQVGELDVLEVEAQVLEDRLAAGQDGDVAQHGLAAIAVARRLHGRDLEDAAQLVDDQGRQRLALDVFGDDQQRLVGLGHLLEERDQLGRAS